MANILVPHWEAARARAWMYQGLGVSERDVLALILALVAAEDGAAVGDISLWSVRYWASDSGRLWQALAAVLPGPLDHVTTTVEDGQDELIRIWMDEHIDEGGRYTGPAELEDVHAPQIEAVVRERAEFGARAPVESRIWRRWAALQAPHGRRHTDTLMSEELSAHYDMDLPGPYVESGLTVFEHALQHLSKFLDKLLLLASGAPPLHGHPLLVTGGIHEGRSCLLDAVTWTVDEQGRVCSKPTVSFTVAFTDRRGTADIDPAQVTLLPDGHYWWQNCTPPGGTV